ncbi:hypothetical protein X962_4219 [Burkholderia pseudomallei MSHR7343]|nr:hypothetical protein X962_4219 [Burkholderia pseudomallei MSHR7343]KGS80829.1 hypothetical protein X947_4016 [Burkholderia pseudomallei MSHR7334]
MGYLTEAVAYVWACQQPGRAGGKFIFRPVARNCDWLLPVMSGHWKKNLRVRYKLGPAGKSCCRDRQCHQGSLSAHGTAMHLPERVQWAA